MKKYDPKIWYLSAALSATAGFCDVLGYLTLGGFFVSFMSGNSTRLGIGLALDAGQAILALSLIITFVFGVVAASVLQHFFRHPTLSYWLLTALLLIASCIASSGMPLFAVFLIALAMGAENTIFQRDGEVSIGLTYMTGTLVKLGQHLSAAFLGGSRSAWIPYALLWCGLVLGGVCGALSYDAFGLNSLWIATLAALCCSLWASATLGRTNASEK